MTDTKGSALPTGGALQATDAIVVVRTTSGTPATITAEAGTAASRTASDATKTNLASVSGTIAVGHLAVFSDANGSIVDGGAVPSGGGSGTAASKAASNNALAAVASVPASVVAGHVATFADTSGTLQDGGVLGSAAALAAGSANGVATLDGTGKVPVAQLPAAVVGALNYQGAWNASTNSPTLTSSTGTKGYYYKVSVAGTTNLDGTSDWQAGDLAAFNGTTWDRIDGTDDANLAKLNVAQTFTAQQAVAEGTLTDASSIAWNLNTQANATVTLAGNRALANPTNMIAGATYTLRVKQDATGSRTLSYGTAFKWPGGTAPTLTTTAGATDIISFYCDGASLYGSIQQAFA